MPMIYSSTPRSPWIGGVLVAVTLALVRPADADSTRSTLHGLRTADCGIAHTEVPPWHPDRRLDEAAKRWARGTGLNEAVERSGYTATALSGLHLYGLDAPERPPLNASTCRILRDRSLKDIGAFRQRGELWVLFASRADLPNPEDRSTVARRALDLVNEARERGHRCGSRHWPSAKPLRLSAKLSQAAAQHAQDMADHHYFEHIDPRGRTPADRVKAAGYREQLVGENIALGTLSTEDAIAGWLKSPEHCANVMDLRFKEMGIAYVQKRGGRGELYWVQLLANPQ